MNLYNWPMPYTVRKMTENDIDIIYKLSLSNPMFYQYCPPNVTKDSIISDMEALPPGCTEKNKYYIGFFKGNCLIAVMDLILDYPDIKNAYIGLFMVDKNFQGTGVGSAIIAECLNCLKNYGFHSIRLAFAKGNPQSEAFWKKNGFCPTGIEIDQGDYIAVSMEKII